MSSAKDASKPEAQTMKSTGDGQQKSDKLNSASSDLSELTSDGNGSSISQPTPSEEAEQGSESMDEDVSGTGSSDVSENDEDTPRRSGKGPSREERVKYRDLLNKKLETMFVKAKMELTPYGRIPWTKLGETLSSHGYYITGFPEEFAPRVTNDQLIAGTAPSTWSLNRTRPLLALIDQGKIRIMPRAPGRRVLFELTRANGTKFDSTIGYSSRWLHANMPLEFPSIKRSRSDAAVSSSKSSQSPSRNEEASDWSSDSGSDKDDASIAWKPHRKRPRLTDSRSPSIQKNLRNHRQESSTPALRSKAEKPSKAKEEIKQGEKWKEGGIVKKVGRGWIVVEESTEEEDTSSKKEEPVEEQPLPPRRASAVPRHEIESKKRKHSAPPEAETPPRPVKRVHPEVPPLPTEATSSTAASEEKTLKMVVTRISRLIHDAGYNGSKKIPWSTLPTFLAQRKLYATGFPYSCLPRVVNDEVKKLSSPPHWKPIQCSEMADSLNRNQVKILPRPSGRRVLFEAIGVDGKVFDSTLGFSATWVEANIKEPEQPSASKKATAKKGVSKQSNGSHSHSPRPSLKLVIPDTGTRLDNKPDHREKVAKPPASKRMEEPKVEKPVQAPEKRLSPVPRASIPSPIILLHPPTPLEGRGSPIAPAKLQLEDSPMVESPTAGRSTTKTSEPQSPHNLTPPPLPPPIEPVARPTTPPHEEKASTSTIQPLKRAKFTFTIPPVKKAKPSTGLTESSTSDNMSIDGNISANGSKGYNLDLMFESPSVENPLGGLPTHLQPKVSTSMSPVSVAGKPAAPMKAPTLPFSKSPLGPGEEIVGVIQITPNVSMDSKYGIERVVRPALVKLFDAAGLSSPGTPIPWVMLPLMLCQRQLFITGFPRNCLPKVVRDKVDGSSGPRGWSYAAFVAMLNALKAGEVKIKHRPHDRRVLFHLLPTDAQREEGDKHGTDSTLSFSQAWLDEHMVDDPDELPDEPMQFEPSEQPIVIARPAPLRRESSVWERFGKIKIEESESEDEDRVPDPPWKVAMREFMRPQNDDADSTGTKEASAPSESSDEERDVDEEPNLTINHLLPSRIPHSFQGKGRIVLGRDDLFEWIPNNPYATDCPPERMVWCPIKRKWKLLAGMRDMDGWARGVVRQEIPNRVGGKILGKGVCEHNATRKVWECSFVGRSVFGDLRWAADIASWEWVLQDADGRRKWITPHREYGSDRDAMLSPMSI